MNSYDTSMPFDPEAFRLNSPLGKRILAAVREGDYAHPGEETAIDLALRSFAKSPPARWLDAGCGRGGTAAYVVRKKWADVTAFDIDAVTIEADKHAYPDITFFACDVKDSPRVIPGKYDLIYLFNSFYSFPDQPAALRALRDLATDSARLVIFEYVDRGGFYESEISKLPEGKHWRPIEEKNFAKWLHAAGWSLEETRNLDAEYECWYAELVARFGAKRETLTAIAPPEAIEYARNFYSLLLAAIRSGALGGALYTASAT